MVIKMSAQHPASLCWEVGQRAGHLPPSHPPQSAASIQRMAWGASQKIKEKQSFPLVRSSFPFYIHGLVTCDGHGHIEDMLNADCNPNRPALDQY